jgi:hypothetical protein
LACQIGRHGKFFDHQPIGMCRVPDHEGNASSDGEADKACGYAQQHAEALLPDVEPKLLELFVQVMALVANEKTLVCDQGSLIVQKRISGFLACSA